MRIPEDLASLVFENLHIVVLLNVLMTCKQYYAMRKTVIQNNSTVRKYAKYDPSESFVKVLLCSNVRYNNMMQLVFNYAALVSSRDSIHKTYKVIAFDKSISQKSTYKDALVVYYNIRLQQMYPNFEPERYDYRMHTKTPKRWFVLFMRNYSWEHCNIDLFDIYNIMVCTSLKNYKELANVLVNMRISAPREFKIFYDIFKTMLEFLDHIDTAVLYNKIMKSAIICVVYKFLLQTPREFFKKNLLNSIRIKSDYLAFEINNIKYIPKYLKQILLNPLQDMIQRVEAFEQ